VERGVPPPFKKGGSRVTQVRITDERREALRRALFSGWAEQMFLIISDVAAIEPDSLPQERRRGVDAARITLKRFQEVQCRIETGPEMWKALLSDEYDRTEKVTEPLEQLIDAQLEAEYHGPHGARANVQRDQPGRLDLARPRSGSPRAVKACLAAVSAGLAAIGVPFARPL
jgi:hypothetical protein